MTILSAFIIGVMVLLSILVVRSIRAEKRVRRVERILYKAVGLNVFDKELHK